MFGIEKFNLYLFAFVMLWYMLAPAGGAAPAAAGAPAAAAAAPEKPKEEEVDALDGGMDM